MSIENNNETQQHRHLRKKEESTSRLWLRNIMNLIFMIGVITLVVLYFIKPNIQQNTTYIVFALFVVAIKIAEMTIRFLPK